MTRAKAQIPPRTPKAAARDPRKPHAPVYDERWVQRRRDDLFAVLDRYDEVTRRLVRRFEKYRPGYADAMWDAMWELRIAISNALAVCEATEKDAWWFDHEDDE